MTQKVPSPFSTSEWIRAWQETIGKEWELLDHNLARKGNELILAGGYEVADYLDISDRTLSLQQHIRIYNAIKEKDPEKARSAMAIHLSTMESRLKKMEIQE